MANDLNRFIFTGNLTRNPELRRTSEGTAILNFGVAINESRKNNSTGEWENYANFVDCAMFGARAESLSDILTTGMKVSIDGKIRYSSWDDNGSRRSRLTVLVNDIVLMTRSGDEINVTGENVPYEIMDEDIPF